MNEISKLENIDIRSVHWGEFPAPLLPQSLRNAWRQEPLPDWVCEEIGLKLGSTTFADLGSDIWQTMKSMSPRLHNFLTFTVRSRNKSIQGLKCVERVWPAGLKSEDIGWAIRTRNMISRKGWIHDEERLTDLTFRELFTIGGMGPTTVLDYCSSLEGAIDIYEKFASYYAKNLILKEGNNKLASDSRNSISQKEDIGSLGIIALFEEVVNEDWAAQISEQDPRFSKLVPLGRGSLQERVERLLSENEALDDITEVASLAEALPIIKQRVSDIANLSLEECLSDFLEEVSKLHANRLGALSARLGWDGNKSITLEEGGKRIGVTRERFRQIQSNTVKRFPDHEVLMPQLDKALALMEERVPLTLSQASRILQDESITVSEFHPLSLLDAADLLHKKTGLQICETSTGKMLVSDANAKTVKLIPSIGRKLAGGSGVTSVYQLMDALHDKGHEIDEEDLLRMLHANQNFEFLDDFWFWGIDISNKRNRLVNVVKKILSVVAPQEIKIIREGVGREYRGRQNTNQKFATLVVPPIDVMREFLHRHNDFRVEGDLVYPMIPLNYINILGENSCIMVEVLRTAPAGVMDRKSFEEGCVNRGMNPSTFSLYSTYSCILEHVGIDIWKLRGVKVDPAAVEAVRIANHLKPREKRVIEYGWSSDGNLRLAIRIPRTNKSSFVVGCPAEIMRFLVGQEFQCRPKNSDLSCGTITINEKGMSYGYGMFFRRYGLDENDILLAEFNLSTNVVFLSVSNDDLIEDLA